MFNRRISDDLAVVQDIAALAVAQGRVPGPSASRGNAAGAFSSVVTELSTSSVLSGTNAAGDTTFPLLLDIDPTNSTEARLG
jgi:hypothetical protein